MAPGLKTGVVVWLLHPDGRLIYKNGGIVSGIVRKLIGRGRNRQALIEVGGCREWWSVTLLHKSTQQPSAFQREYEAEMDRIVTKRSPM